MKNFKKYLTCFCIALIILLSSFTLATDNVNNSSVNNTTNVSMPIKEASNTSASLAAQSIYKDLYIYNTDSYSLVDIVYGNIFASTTQFTTNPKNNGGIISRKFISNF